MQNLSIKRIIDILPYQIEHYPRDNAFCDKVLGQWRKYSSVEAQKIADTISLGLIKLGIKPKDRVAIISNNRTEWNFADFGILQIGATVVPLYPNMSEDNYKFIFDDSQVKLVFVESEELYKKVQRVLKKTTAKVINVYTFDKVKSALHLDDLMSLADSNDKEELNRLKNSVTEDYLVTIIYTSGTTGVPKGVMLTHKNIASNVVALNEIMPTDKYDRTISFLPLSHIFERTAVYFYMSMGAAVHYPESLDKLTTDIKEVKPQHFITVPRLLEKIYEKIMEQVFSLPLYKKAIFGWAVNLANNFDPQGNNDWFYNFRLYFARKLVFKKWNEALGGNVHGIISGSAALQPRLARIFSAAGMHIIEGYGLTETSPVITCNRYEKGNYCMGSVGLPIPGVSVKIAENGEILAKGPNVMVGYYNQPEATKAAFDEEGWFHTGDTGEFIDGRFLKITGRIKEIFKTSGGKFIAPQPIENKMKESFFIEQIMVIGENERFAAAIILPSFDFLNKWCEEKNLNLSSPSEMIHSEKVKERILKEVKKYNKRFGHVQQVKKIALVSDPWSVETGELTPTMKVKRRIILERYKHLIEKIYDKNTTEDVVV